MAKFPHTHLFRTNFDAIEPNSEVVRTLDSLHEIVDWSVDADRIGMLRVVSRKLKPSTIALIVRSFGYECSVLS